MDNRLTTQDLGKVIAARTGKKHREVESFLKNLVSILTDDMETNGSIEIKGLGVFKLTRIEERESIHVNTGERFLIPSHQRYSFIPDKQLKEAVNKPFSFFDTVEVDENIPFTDEEEGEEEEEEADRTSTITIENNRIIPEYQRIEEEEPPSFAEPLKEEEKLDEDFGRSERQDRSRLKQVLYSGLFILMIGLIFFGYKYLKSRQAVIPVTTVDNAPKEPELFLPDHTASGQDTVITAEEEKDSSLVRAPEPEENTAVTAEAEVIANVVIQTGDRLTTLAKKYYGSKLFWVYIYRYNQSKIKNPDQIPIGTTLSIPAPEVYGIDSKDKESMEKAVALQEKILKK